ncbi:DUF1194 domain-containing protein [Rhodovulum sulfidophilum]|uniref:DUF1194 domain-containing protein n=1 Tax=Rhodovulum sulfidophilum TaxID=35806 RepID=UPI0009533822|nr:DUF1194 domain-containing protein [Rhodovulum sulfidophilum]OLS48942.1 hypothetical protein BV379_12075 [Rhodovulum sulfidophilum]
MLIVLGANEFDDNTRCKAFFSGLPGELADHFRAELARGPGAFVNTASGFSDVAETIERKLPRELQAIAVGQVSPEPGSPGAADLSRCSGSDPTSSAPSA